MIPPRHNYQDVRREARGERKNIRKEVCKVVGLRCDGYDVTLVAANSKVSRL